MKSDLPSGTVTFLFTDIEGSTRLWQEKPDAMAVSNDRHDTILREAIETYNGYIFQIVGDSFSAAFHNAQDGLCAALSAQRGLKAEPWGETGAIRVRMGLHTGPAKIDADGSNKYPEGYATIASAQRVMSVAHGGQVLASHTTYDLLQNDLPEQATLRDLGEHRLKDLRSPLRLYQLVTPDLPQEFPPIQSLSILPNNLPVQLTHFVGRDKELSEVERLLAGTRLLTLTGPGGSGKTRLSLQASAAVLEQFPQGAWLVELAPVTDPQIVAQSVANALTVRDNSGRTALEALVDYLRYKNLLLVLDNCEHLIEACARLADHLLRACPNLKILASSREALDIPGEVVFQVPSLSLPPATFRPGGESLKELEQSEAVCLFVERAQAVSPAFCLEAENAPAVAQICRRLDGIPLAIELAAARVKVLTPAQIASRLDDRFRLLTGGSRTALPRHQTIKALIDWSWALLSEPEKKLLSRLAVFAGGFTLEAAESICPDPDPVAAGEASLSTYDILDLLEGLVNKSLIQAAEETNETRYRMLETIRQYALDQLVLAGDIASLRDRHLDYFTRLAEEAEPELRGAGMIEWIDRLGRDWDNLRAAMEWGLASCHPAAIKLARYLFPYWLGSSLDREGMHWLRAAAECLPPTAAVENGAEPGQADRQRLADRSYLQAGAAVLASNLGQNLPALQFEEEAERSARLSGDERALCFALAIKTLAVANFGVITPQLKVDGEESVALARRLEDKWLLAFSAEMLGELSFRAGNPAGGISIMEEFDRLARQIGNAWLIATSIYFALSSGQIQGGLPEIRRVTDEGLELFTRLKNTVFIAAMRSELAHLLRRRGELDEAEGIYLQTIPAWLELGNQGAVAHEFESLAALAIARGQLERSAQLLGTAQALRARSQAEMAPNEHPEYEAVLAELRSRLDAAALQAAWKTGEALDLEQAVAYALAEDGSKPTMRI